MGWLKKKEDPISGRARDLQAEIERLEAQIQQLNQELEKPQPRLRSTAVPKASIPPKPAVASSQTPKPAQAMQEQVFEPLDHQRLQASPAANEKSLYNELGVRRYDLPGAWKRVTDYFRGQESPNQPFVKLLAAGNIQGLKTLRYEKRVARRRFITLVAILFLLLWGIVAMLLRH